METFFEICQNKLRFMITANKNEISGLTDHCYNQSFDTANQQFSELAAAQEFISDFIRDSN